MAADRTPLEEEIEKLKAEIKEARGVITLLLDQVGGSAKFSDKEIVELDHSRRLRSYISENDFSVFVEIEPKGKDGTGI